MMTNAIHVPHPHTEIFSCLLNWQLSEGMRLCWCHDLMNWSGGSTPSCHEQRQVSGAKNSKGGGMETGKALWKKEKWAWRDGEYPQLNATVWIQMLELMWPRNELLWLPHHMYVLKKNIFSGIYQPRIRKTLFRTTMMDARTAVTGLYSERER